MIQPNSEQFIRFLVFDIDENDAARIVEDSGLPPPTFFVENTANGHAHVIYALAAPVSLSGKSRKAPIYLLAAIQRGFTRRLHADKAYGGRLCKTPFHPQWRTVAPPYSLYDAARLCEYLAKDEKAFWPKREPPIGLGRNCFMFEEAKDIAYHKVLEYKKSNRTEEQFRDFLKNVCGEINHKFETPLMDSELRAISKSVSKWVWSRFTHKRFSKIQSSRGKRRWRKTPLTMESLKPWEDDGISRRTWYRRRAKKAEII